MRSIDRAWAEEIHSTLQLRRGQWTSALLRERKGVVAAFRSDRDRDRRRATFFERRKDERTGWTPQSTEEVVGGGTMVSMIFRARLSSFLAGFAVASGFAVYQLRNDVRESHALLAEQVRNSISNSRPRSQTPTDALCVSDPYRSLLHPSLSLSLSLRARKPGGRRAEEASEARGPGREAGVRVPVEQRAVGLGAPRVFWRRPIHNNKRIFFLLRRRRLPCTEAATGGLPFRSGTPSASPCQTSWP